ncbi:FMN-dependent NADH-azoreductase [Streptacidiphilus rugosus]|uniref:FMN-dependent NADH-azoreductase n=1 Tax=Streptacidiphilus rugosus TaxID=405783 RepID=UPI00055D0A68|nr:NAD(P)H-dependent oxidoreductase [Streptacidiphilus rugosus]
MATLLHINSSPFPLMGSASRKVAETFVKTWSEQHPGGTVIHRDLAAVPLPHLDVHGITAAFSSPEQHTAQQQAAFALRAELVAELEAADAVLIGAPMHNLAIPSSLKAWLDHVIVMGRTAGAAQSAAGKPVVVVASRGGSYRPGTPREGFDFVQGYLEAVLGGMMGLKVDVIMPELTLARTDPAMSALVGLADESETQAHADAALSAKELAAALAQR